MIRVSDLQVGATVQVLSFRATVKSLRAEGDNTAMLLTWNQPVPRHVHGAFSSCMSDSGYFPQFELISRGPA